MTTAQDHQYMARAIQLARSSIYSPHPNPRVGCVITLQDEIVGEGWHAYSGGPHAEVGALQQAADCAQGATAYVTLEPCSHHGKTPPCADALIQAGIERVVVAMKDPNPQVAGRGIKRLTDAGISVDVGLLQEEAEGLNPGFLQRMKAAMPYLRSKLAMSLDGRTAMASGESKWITGAAARADVQRLRAGTAAMLTGIGTVLADDPSLTLRAEENGLEIPQFPQQSQQPLRVVLDSRLQMPLAAKVLQFANEVLIYSCSDNVDKITALQAMGVEVVVLAGEQPDLREVLVDLATRQINEVLVEAGATLNGALLAQGLIDELIIYMAPTLMGDGAKGLFHLPALQAMADQVSLQIDDIRVIGSDWRITAKPTNRDNEKVA